MEQNKWIVNNVNKFIQFLWIFLLKNEKLDLIRMYIIKVYLYEFKFL